MNVYEGRLASTQLKIGIVVSRFNEFITRRLLEGALAALRRSGVRERGMDVFWVPGALEVPFFCAKLARRRKYHVLIALACVLRGGTYHFECVAHEVTRGISQAAMEGRTPVATGIITADNLEQAIERAGLKGGNKGEQAALAAIEIADLHRTLA